MEKKEKKGFWASLFAPKSCCCCGPQIEEIKEEDDKEKQKQTRRTTMNAHEITIIIGR